MTQMNFEHRMQALGLKLTASETEMLAAEVAELDAAALLVRAARPYLEQPCVTLRLSPAHFGGK